MFLAGPPPAAPDSRVLNPLLANRPLLSAVVSWALANRSVFFGSHEQERPPREFFGAWAGPGDDLCIYEHKLKEFLHTQGFTYEATMRTWKEMGWLKLSGDRGMKAVRKINGASVRLPTLNREALALSDDG